MSKSEVFFKYPYLIFYIVMGVFVLVGFMNYHSSIVVKDYIETEGEICNLEEEEVYRHKRYQTRYSYDIVWYGDGEMHTKHLDGQIDPVEEGTRTIWVHPDHVDAVLSNSGDIGEDVPLDFLVAIICGIIGTVIYKYQHNPSRMSRSEQIEYYENVRIYSMSSFVLFCIGVIIFAIMTSKEYEQGEYVSPLMGDLPIFFVVLAVISLIIFFRAGRKLKRRR